MHRNFPQFDRCERVRATLQGGRISYLDAGQGQPVLFLHGIGSAGESWRRQVEALSTKYRAIAWDAPGYGESDALTTPTPVADDYANRLTELIEFLGLEQPVVVGHSLGALMAAAYVKRYARQVSALVLADPALGHAKADASLRESKLRDRIALFHELGPSGLAASRGPGLLSGEADVEVIESVCTIMSRVRADGYIPAAHMLASGDLLGDAALFTGPALVLCGTEDTITPPDEARRVAAVMQNAIYEDIPGAGHASYVEQAHIFSELISTFIDQVCSAQSTA